MRIITQSVELLNALPYIEMLQNVITASDQCYKKGDRCTLTNIEEMEKKVRARISAGHLSVIEHISVSMKVITNRAISHELVRHRLASFTQASTRYQDYSKNTDGLTFIRPMHLPALPTDMVIKHSTFVSSLGNEYLHWYDGRKKDEQEYLETVKDYGPDVARGCLPNDLATSLVITANMREWRHIFELRAFNMTGKAHPQITEISKMAYSILSTSYPVFFEGLDK